MDSNSIRMDFFFSRSTTSNDTPTTDAADSTPLVDSTSATVDPAVHTSDSTPDTDTGSGSEVLADTTTSTETPTTATDGTGDVSSAAADVTVEDVDPSTLNSTTSTSAAADTTTEPETTTDTKTLFERVVTAWPHYYDAVDPAKINCSARALGYRVLNLYSSINTLRSGAEEVKALASARKLFHAARSADEPSGLDGLDDLSNLASTTSEADLKYGDILGSLGKVLGAVGSYMDKATELANEAAKPNPIFEALESECIGLSADVGNYYGLILDCMNDSEYLASGDNLKALHVLAGLLKNEITIVRFGKPRSEQTEAQKKFWETFSEECRTRKLN